jgi:glutathione S-transferase
MKLYGVAGSRAFRSLWALEEIGLEYEHILTNFVGETRTPEYLKINPNGHIPALIDGDVTLWESMAINLYLARKYDGGLRPKSLEDEAHAIKWSIWAMTEAEPPLFQILMNRILLPEDQRNPAAAEEGVQKLQAPLGVLEGALEGRPHLLGPDFTIADLNVAAVLSWVRFIGVDVSGYAGVARWMNECLGRPAAKRAQGR